MSYIGQRSDVTAAQHLSAIVESSSDAIIGKTLDGTITSWSRGAEQIYGYAAGEILGQSISVLIPDDREDELAWINERLTAGECIDGLSTHRLHKNGQVVDVALTISPINDENGCAVGAVAIARDITEQSRTRDALNYRVAFEDLVSSISTDFVNLEPDETDMGIINALATIGEFAEVDRSYVFQFSHDQTTMANTHEWCAEGIERQAHRLHNAALNALPNFTGPILRNEVVYVPSTDDLPLEAEVEKTELRYQEIKSLVLVPMVLRGKTIGFVGFDSVRSQRHWSDEIIRLLTLIGQIFVNALERRRAATQLHERELQYRRIFESTGDGLVITDPDTGIVLEANPAMCRMHGYEYEEFIGLHRTAFVHSDYHRHLKDYVGTVSAGGEYRIRAMDVRKDGSLFHVEANGSAMLFYGRPAILGVIRDVTNDVEAYELLERRVDQRTQELSALLEISHNVASTLDLDSLLDLILDQLTLVIDHTGSAILTVEGEALVMAGHRNRVTGEGAALHYYPLSGLTGVWERILAGESIVVPDIQDNSPESRIFRGVVGDNVDTKLKFIRSCIWTPLMVKDQVIGLLSITNREADAFTQRDATLAAAIARQAAIAIENARLFEQAQGKAALEERQKLARELHDSVSQALYGIALGTQTARTLLDRDPSQAAAPMDYVLSLAEAGLAEMRALIFELRPESLANEGLVAALTKQTAALSARYQIEVTLDAEEEPAVHLEAKEVLYRIAQEAMHNTVKHARASRIRIRLSCSERLIEMEVEDDGVGFDAGASFPGHLGLKSMRERTLRMGGQIEIESAPGAGARVRTMIPVTY